MIYVGIMRSFETCLRWLVTSDATLFTFRINTEL